MTSRNWCITCFANIDLPLAIEEASEKDKAKVRYFVSQHETCPETGKAHQQAFIMLKDPQRMSFLKKLFDDEGLHCEKMKGTPVQVNAEKCCVLRRAEPSRANLNSKKAAGSNICPLCIDFLFPYRPETTA